MANSIVTTNVSLTTAPTPSTLQSTGALISQGATTLAPGSYSLLTQLADLTPLLVGALPFSTVSWATNVATVTTTLPHGFTIGDTLTLVIAGASPSGYNGTYTCTVTSTTQFTYPLLTNPGTLVTAGTYAPEEASELVAMATTFFAQGSQQAVYVLELGAGNATDGATYLTSWITANPGVFYSYLVPRYWDNNATFLSLASSLNGTTAKTYFFVTSTLGTYTNYTASMKSVMLFIEAPNIPSTEFSAAAAFWATLHYAPSSTNKVTPTAFAFVFGVTPYPTKGNAALLATLKAASVNVIGTGAEGGISTTILLWGTLKDGNDFTYWYSIDWVSINVDLAVANAVINGSNNPINPLYYNQNGINRLEQVVATTMASGVTFGLVLNPVTQVQLTPEALTQALTQHTYGAATIVNAVPFVNYTAQHPSDYKTGVYGGLSVVYTPTRGFVNIVFNVNVSQFVTV